MANLTPTRPTAGSSTLAASPAYIASRKYTLYGSEDYAILDLGSRYWKYGFSGEAGPRGVLDITTLGARPGGVWSLSCAIEWSEEDEHQVEAIVQAGLRKIIYRELMLDPKSRKVLIVENPLLPIRVKNLVAKVLFGNLQIPSLTFALSPLLSLLAIGSLTGLVVDCGFLETCATPVYHARPLFNYMHSTSCAGKRLKQRLRSLLLKYARYTPPPNLSSTNTAPRPTAGPVPSECLTPSLLEDLATRALFVGSPITQEASFGSEPNSDVDMQDVYDESKDVRLLESLKTRYEANSSATSLNHRISNPHSPAGTLKGLLVVPGWIRERAADVLFESGDVDEPSVVEVILDVILQLPIDLRKPFCSSILLTGGVCMLPGYTTRLRQELVFALSSPSTRRQTYASRFAPLSALSPSIAISNDPCHNLSLDAHGNSGKAPPFAMSLLPWIGASMAAGLKTSGETVLKEKWETLPDWTIPLAGWTA